MKSIRTWLITKLGGYTPEEYFNSKPGLVGSISEICDIETFIATALIPIQEVKSGAIEQQKLVHDIVQEIIKHPECFKFTRKLKGNTVQYNLEVKVVRRNECKQL